ncbi:hypothetical protein GOBAR_DD12394 [Gossypium barbadense]|nr:hypothetical protein GOBAR_DD12394 [Gossypium barbadense]
MIEVGHTGGSSSQANSENGNHSHLHPEESTSELANEFRTEWLLTEANGSGFMNTETSEETAEHSQPLCNDLSKNTISESLGLLPEDSSKNIQADQISSPQLCSAEPTFSSGELPEQQQQLDSQSLPNGIGNSLSAGVSNEGMELNPKDIIMGNGGKHLQLPSKDANPLGLPQELASTNPTIQQPDRHCEDISKDSGLEQHETTPKNLVKNSGQRKGGKTSKQWKGLSLEKLKPEKELQRAASEILRRKLKIRDLFQRIESLCTEGRLAESLFDSEGEIDSEDIFCAICGSKDIPANNDIILCDGACDRGFHQYCLQPPLLKEDIPPDDEGWLCPGCDCKFDCIELVNESQGTNFSLEDSWEKVFPEAALAAGGQNQDPNYGLPSDDSDDNDYNPDISENDEKDQEDESSSDESDFTSTSDEVEVPAKVDPYLGLPSDDSEDDDYNPDGPDQDHDNVAKSESSSSDFSSDSDDLGAMLVDDISSQKGHMSNGSSRKSKSKKPKLSGKKSLNSEVLTTMEPASGEDDATVSEKRSIPRLDYKRLYDETYGNVPSSSSDDEDWNDGTAPRKKKKRNAEVATTSANGNASPTGSVSVSNGLKNPGEKRAPRRSANGLKQNRGERHTTKRSANGLKQNPEEDHTPRRRTRKKSNQKGTAKLPKATPKSPAKLPEPTPTPGSSGKKAGSSTYKRLGEAVTQGLQKSFKQNQYPDRAMKESLAKELGITFRQVSKWFENARWFFNNSNNVSGESPKKVAGNDITPSARRKKK